MMRFTSARRHATPSLSALALVAALAGAHAAWAAKPNEAPASAAVPTEPQQTMSTFGDWVVRCERPAAPPATGGADQATPKRLCEAAQALVVKGQQTPIAQIAFGRSPGETGREAGKDATKDATKAGDGDLTLTVLLPVNIAFDKPPQLVGSSDAAATVLAIKRCLPGGCFAVAKPTAEFLKDLRSTTKPGRLTFTDAADRTLTLPLSYRGLSQALDDLARETAKDDVKSNG